MISVRPKGSVKNLLRSTLLKAGGDSKVSSSSALKIFILGTGRLLGRQADRENGHFYTKLLQKKGIDMSIRLFIR